MVKVYTCKSDTESKTKDDDIVMGVTSFIDVPLTYVVIYGCTDTIMEDIIRWLRRYRRSAFHPLMFPMIFVEVERTRLINTLEDKSPDLVQRVDDMEQRLRHEGKKDDMSEKDESGLTIFQEDCRATKSWMSVSALKNGLESFIAVLKCINDHPQLLAESEPDVAKVLEGHEKNTIKVHERLKMIELELQGKVRTCDGILGAMALATQMVRLA